MNSQAGNALRPGRWLIYAILFGFALFALLPLIVIVLNSFRTAVEIGRSSLIGWPAGLVWRNWSEARASSPTWSTRSCW